MAGAQGNVVVKGKQRRNVYFAKRRASSKEKGDDPVPAKVERKAKKNKANRVPTEIETTSTGCKAGQKSRFTKLRTTARKRKDACCDDETSKDDTTVGNQSYTPLEKQVMAIKQRHPNTILMVECGYRFRFFGEDAEIASKELRIMCNLSHNFMTASIPSHRVHIHLERLVQKGYKVGVVRQTESAALKLIGDSKSSVFSRELSSLFTRSTLIGEDLPLIGEDATSGGYLMSICQAEAPVPNHVLVGIVVVQPTTGDVLYDCFDENPYGSELEQRLEFLRPVEVILPEGSPLHKTVAQYQSSSREGVRVECLGPSEFEFSPCLGSLIDFYADGERSCDVKQLFELPPVVVSCFGSLLSYLKTFRLETALNDLSRIVPMSRTGSTMLLPAPALKRLEIFRNSVDGSARGSLFMFLKRTVTAFGSQLLESWLGQPLCDIGTLEERQNAVEEVLTLGPLTFGELKKFMSRMPNVQRGLCAILHKKVKPCDVFFTLLSLSSISKMLRVLSCDLHAVLKSSALKECLLGIPDLLRNVDDYLNLLSEDSAKKNDTTNLLNDLASYPGLQLQKEAVAKAEAELQEHRISIAALLGLRDFDYKTVNGLPYLIEVPNRRVSSVPSDWLKMSATKAVSRFRSPEVNKLYSNLCVAKELLVLEGEKAWLTFLSDLGTNYNRFQRAVKLLATLDCYFALAEVASQPGYCRPRLLPKEQTTIQVKNGRHPVLDQLSGLNYVSNDTNINDTARCVIITGPNMGGKSSYIRQVALIIIMAQLGSFVPAESATLSILDGVYVRMGAEDNLLRQKSTFLIEMQETSELLSGCTEHSLVVLDELGRGTATHDGTAIAVATLRYLVEEKRCPTLFVTHYLRVTQLEDTYPEKIKNFHVAFEVDTEESVTFLYRLVPGAAKKSYGLNVALLAGVPPSVVARARVMAERLEDATLNKR
ncbi:DNA mismatch repair protein Msh3-like isoform X2 [Ornithodoros turicata]|uniref:DNA mismatch repair protein Msh3-like isoform X2 n=1 Tax=Ornithodoros turicata TaxID=34597 RepID=UPI0031393B4D